MSTTSRDPTPRPRPRPRPPPGPKGPEGVTLPWFASPEEAEAYMAQQRRSSQAAEQTNNQFNVINQDSTALANQHLGQMPSEPLKLKDDTRCHQDSNEAHGYHDRSDKEKDKCGNERVSESGMCNGSDCAHHDSRISDKDQLDVSRIGLSSDKVKEELET